MGFTEINAEKYAERHTNVFKNSLLDELERKTNLEIMQPKMLSGFHQGQLLAFISFLINPKNILEIGTYTGYSSICMAQGLVKDGIIHTIDNNPEIDEFSRNYLKKCNKGNQIIKHLGNAADIIPEIKLTWDLVFLDADKLNYPLYYELVLPELRPGGLIIADNVLWYGHVTKEKKEKRAEALDKFNKLVTNDLNTRNILLPLRDGIMLIQKI